MRRYIFVCAAAVSLLSACAEADPCNALKSEIEMARAEGVSRASHRLDIGVGGRRGRGLRVVDQHDFMPTAAGLSAMHTCLGAEWRGDVEGAVREGWRAPAVVFKREGYPDVVLLDDTRHLQILIEHHD